MKRALAILAVASALAAPAAEAACYVDYKAKKDAPLRLHYGVLEIPDAICGNGGSIREETARRIARGGWTLLNVVSVFGPEGLDERRASAGEFFLRF